MQAVVLVGGEGTRLRPLTFGTPKPMIPVMNVPFLERTLRRLKEAGIDDVILPAGYLPEAITALFRRRQPARPEDPRTSSRRRRSAPPARSRTSSSTSPARSSCSTATCSRASTCARCCADHERKGGIGDPAPDPRRGSVGVRLRRARCRRPHHARSSRSPSAKKRRPTRSTPARISSKRRCSTAIPAGRPVSIERETFPPLIAAGKRLYAYTTERLLDRFRKA